MTADTLRKGGLPFQIIFGLTLPQISAIAKECGENKDLALKLWENRSTRCSMLLAPMLMPVTDFTFEKAEKWSGECPSTETADVLCLKLLSKVPYKHQLIERLMPFEGMKRYVAMRLILQSLRRGERVNSALMEQIQELADVASQANMRLLALQILDEYGESGI